MKKPQKIKGRRDSKGGKPRLCVTWEEDLFLILVNISENCGVSFSALANEFVRDGLKSRKLEDS